MVLPTYITVFLLFFLPLIVIPLGYSFFEIPKVLIAETLILTVSVYLFLKHSHNLFCFKRKFFYLISAIFVLSLIDLLFFRTSVTLFGNIYRLQGVFSLWNLLILSLLIAPNTNLKILPKKLLLIPLGGLFATVFIYGTDVRGKYVGSLGDANSLAATAVFIWPFVYFRSEHRIVKIVSLLIAITTIAISGSRTGILALALQLIILLGTRIFKLNLIKTVSATAILLLFSLLTPFFDQPGMFENRAEIWKTALTNPYNQYQNGNFSFTALFIGRGFGNIEQVLPQLSVALDNNVRFQYVDSAHNIFLDWWIQGGLIGIIILFWLTHSTIKTYLDHNDQMLTIAFLGILATLLFNPLSFVNLMQFWWLIGFSFNSVKT